MTMTTCERALLSLIAEGGPMDRTEIDESEEDVEYTPQQISEALDSLQDGALIVLHSDGEYSATPKGREIDRAGQS